MTEAEIVEITYQDLHEPVQEEPIKEIPRIQTAKARAVRDANAQERGYYIAGMPPYGYRWENGQLIPHPKESAVIAMAQQLKANGFSYSQIAEVLAANGYTNRNGNAFCRQDIHQLLTYQRKSLVALIPK